MRLGTDIMMGLVVAVLSVVLITEAYAQTPQLPTPKKRYFAVKAESILKNEISIDK